MTDGGGGGISTGGRLGPVDWSYSSPHFNSKDFLHNDSYFANEDDDDDDLDSYYMDLPPVDMTERLKEVNRALAEDLTPVEGSRITKLRFREVIADFQSPRESVIVSDSDDGYGDSSDIMFDAEEENDILCPTSTTVLKNRTDLQDYNVQISNPEEYHQPSVILPANKDESANVTLNPITMSNIQVSSTCSLSPTKGNVLEETKPILKYECSEVEKEEIVEDISEIIEEISSSEYKKDPVVDDVFLPVSVSESIKYDDEEKLFAKSNGRFSKCYKMSDIQNLESDIDEEIEEFNQDFFLREDSSDNLSSSESNQKLENDCKIPEINVQHVTVPQEKLGISKDTTDTSQSNQVLNVHVEDNSITIKNKNDVREQILNIKKRKPSPLPDSKRSRETRLSSSQPIPNIKSNLMTPSTYQPLKNSKQTAVVSTSMRRSRSQTIYSPNKPSLANSIQPTRTHKSTSSLSKRNTKFNDKKPMKAIHNQNAYSNSELFSTYERRSVPRPMVNNVRKAASTSDLTRGFDDRQKLNDDIYGKWLIDKKKSLAISKRQCEVQKNSEEAHAVVKLKERKKMAEDAFQQWLRRKRDQLRAEKKLRSERRKLDQHSIYARTRTQCDDAYTEWCQRKQEEIAHRRISGVNVRSRSLERTWIQEKTRKLYNAYLSKQ